MREKREKREVVGGYGRKREGRRMEIDRSERATDREEQKKINKMK